MNEQQQQQLEDRVSDALLEQLTDAQLMQMDQLLANPAITPDQIESFIAAAGVDIDGTTQRVTQEFIQEQGIAANAPAAADVPAEMPAAEVPAEAQPAEVPAVATEPEVPVVAETPETPAVATEPETPAVEQPVETPAVAQPVETPVVQQPAPMPIATSSLAAQGGTQ